MKRLDNSELTTVMHSIPCWLEQTQAWNFTQIISLPRYIDSHIVCNTTENLDQFDLPNIHCLDQAPKWKIHLERALNRLRLQHRWGFVAARCLATSAHILHSHFGPMGWANLGIARRLGLKHVVTFYGYDVNLPKSSRRWRRRYRQLFHHVDLVLCEGPHMAQCIVALGCSDAKVRVHHLGVMLDRLLFRARVWSPGEPLRVLIAASFREKKGIPYAIEALGRFQHEVDLEVTIIGDARIRSVDEVEEKQKILSEIAKHRLEGKVKMLGFQPHAMLIKEAYRNHVYLAPSVTTSSGDTEGGAPVSVIELAATGMPVVSTLHCDIPEVIQHGVSGLLAQERDVDGLVDHLRWLVQNPHGWLPMVTRAREHLDLEFAASAQGARLGSIYRLLLVGGAQ